METAEKHQAVRTVVLEGRTQRFAAGAGEPILLAALKAGVPLAYECGSGTCGSCRARLIEGRVASRWPDAPGLSPEARARGEVLLCQAEPLGDCRVAAKLLAAGGQELPLVRSLPGVIESAAPCALDMYHLTIRLQQEPRFLPGQYVLLDLPGVHGLRAYSIANTMGHDAARLELYVRRSPGGSASPILCDSAAQGMRLRVHGPMGLAYLPPGLSSDLLCIAGGSGLAPILSIVRTAAATGYLNDYRLSLFVGARSEAHLFAIEELEALRERYPETVELSVSLSAAPTPAAPGRELGFVHEAVARHIRQLPDREVFLAGPAQMVDACKRTLIGGGVRPRRIHFDRFT